MARKDFKNMTASNPSGLDAVVRTTVAQEEPKTKKRYNIAIDGELHRRLRFLSVEKDVGLGKLIEEALLEYLSRNENA